VSGNLLQGRDPLGLEDAAQPTEVFVNERPADVPAGHEWTYESRPDSHVPKTFNDELETVRAPISLGSAESLRAYAAEHGLPVFHYDENAKLGLEGGRIAASAIELLHDEFAAYRLASTLDATNTVAEGSAEAAGVGVSVGLLGIGALGAYAGDKAASYGVSLLGGGRDAQQVAGFFGGLAGGGLLTRLSMGGQRFPMLSYAEAGELALQEAEWRAMILDAALTKSQKPATVASVVNMYTGDIFTSASRLGKPLENVTLGMRLRSPRVSLTERPVANCGEFGACNQAQRAGQSDGLVGATVGVRAVRGGQKPCVRCPNCQKSTSHTRFVTDTKPDAE
jgi:hypothetical protein